jgi:XTP/dITP diphosphohydrolase
MQTLLIATHNTGKLREYRELLADLPLQVVALADVGICEKIAETGDTFVANATLKAQGYAALSRLVTWADDSGLEVDALGGRPGIHSADYGGAGLTDRARYMLLLNELTSYDRATWTARFRCVVALATPDGRILTVDDTVEGVITDTPRGEHGFGYDPIFYIPAEGATMAELPPTRKNAVSHRGKAARRAKEVLRTLLADTAGW